MPTMTRSRAEVEGLAVFSDDGRYRYSLSRVWGPGPAIAWVMLNPSTADGSWDDATLRRIQAFSRRTTNVTTYGRLEVVNLFAYRAVDPTELLATEDPVGPDNDAHIDRVVRGATTVVAAWGAWAERVATGRAHTVTQRLPRDRTYALGRTRSGAPRHPLRLAGDTPWQYYR